MLDTVINGTRTSRSILGNLSIPEDWALARAQLVGEGWPIDFGPLNDAGLSQKGTDLNKSTLLTDETAALLGLDSAAVPDDAFRKCTTVLGSYEGTGTWGETRTIELGFRPRAVYVRPTGPVPTYDVTTAASGNFTTFINISGGLALDGYPLSYYLPNGDGGNGIEVVDNGFNIAQIQYQDYSKKRTFYFELSKTNTTYIFIVFP